LKKNAYKLSLDFSDQKSEMEIITNDKVIMEELFGDVSQQILASSPDLKKDFAEFLANEFVLKSDYRDHHPKNFQDKIFFFEPTNKFYDVLWIKRVALKNLVLFDLSHLEVPSPPQLSLAQKDLTLSSEKYEAFVEKVVWAILEKQKSGQEWSDPTLLEDKFIHSLLN